MTFTSGQRVVWLYRPRGHRQQRSMVDAEIVQFGQLRTRIRIRTAGGAMLLRWVHPKNLRLKAPDEPDYPYPELR